MSKHYVLAAGGTGGHMVPAAALAQAPRIARVRSVPVERVRTLVTDATDASILGEPRVNVLALNRALDALPASGAPAR